MSSRSIIRAVVRVSLLLSAIVVFSGACAIAVGLPRALPPQPLADALDTFAQLSGLQVIYRAELAAGRTSQGSAAGLSAQETLKQLLRDTGLTYTFVNDRMVTIQAVGSRTTPQDSNGQPHRDSAAGDGTSLQLAQTDTAANSPATPTTPDSTTVHSTPATVAGESDTNRLQEVIVTAQKRVERLQDVPIPVSALSATSLVDSNQVKLQDYYTEVPGLSVAPAIQSSQIITIRGVTTGGEGTNPTVGVTVDDMPYGSTNVLVVPDIDPGDLERIEVLRGPQGTLYGASSLGGLLKFVTVDPSPAGFSGRVEAGTSGVVNGAEMGYSLRGSINVPITDTLAFRASAFTRQDPGYIDNPVLKINGLNEDRASGAHLSALWRPTSDFSLKLGALYQVIKGDGTSDITALPGLSGLQQDYVRGIGPYRREVQAYSAVVNDKIGKVDITSVTGFNINSFTDGIDTTFVLGPLSEEQFGVGGAPIYEGSRAAKFTQEIRLSAPLTQWLDALLGGFYTHENTAYWQRGLATDPLTGEVAGVGFYSPFPYTYAEEAAFGDLTFHLTERFQIQAGARESQIKESFSDSFYGPFTLALTGVPSPLIGVKTRSKDNAFTYLLTPQLKVTPDLLVYARIASGYRPGGPNPVAEGVAPQYDPDKTQNYEIGVKGEALDRTLSFDGSIYYIDWKHIQLGLLSPGDISYIGNAGAAKSQGVELSVESRPVRGLTMRGWVTWIDAVLTQGFPSSSTIYGISGNRLPYSSRFSGNISVDDEFPLAYGVTGFAGASLAYVGDRLDVFTGDAQRQDLPSYTKMDLRLGAKYDSWTLNFYVNNVADRRGIISGGLGNFVPYSFYLIQPRTVGMSLARAF